MKIKHLVKILSLLAIVGIAACAGQSFEGRLLDFPSRHETSKVATAPQNRPWEIWVQGADLRGNNIRDLRMLEADRLYQSGDISAALTLYNSIAIQPDLGRFEREALAYRISAAHLSRDQADLTLQALSDYFQREALTVEDVNSQFSLLFGYGYARKRDADQSLAWFSRANRIAAERRGLSQAAENGARKLIGSLPESEFYKLSADWFHDVFINTLIAQERQRRAQPSYAGPVPADSLDAFWTSEPLPGGASGLPFEQENRVLPAAGKTRIAALLPLSGRFGALGRSAKNGIEIALSAQGDELYEVTFLDTKGEVPVALEQLQIAYAEGTRVVIGPLLSDPSLAVANMAKSMGINVISFSKNDDFYTGSGVYRMGPTALSQMRSLLAEVSRSTAVSNIAIVFPRNILGEEFLRAFRQVMSERGMQPALEAAYTMDREFELAAIAEELERNRNIQAVFFPDNIELGARLFSNFTPQFRNGIFPLGAANWDNTVRLTNSKGVLNGAIFVSPFFHNVEREVVSRFVEIYETTYGGKPDFLAAQGFDAATMVIAALRQSALQKVPFARAFELIDNYDGLTGRMSVNRNGEVERQFEVVTMRDGVIARLTQSEVAVPSFSYRGNFPLESASDALSDRTTPNNY
jgi:ABC-type branched-subunit amino acid transport system substrate-binding protein